MPTLDEIRRMLRGEASAIEEHVGVLDRSKIKAKRKRYTISLDGFDATLGFGKWNGHSISDMAKTRAGRDYLEFILRDFDDEELKSVVEYQLAEKSRSYDKKR